MLRGLSDSEIQSIHETSLKVLEQIGVDICHDQIRKKLLAVGAKPGSTSERVLFPRKMVMEALGKCDRNITLSCVRDQDYTLTSDSRFYSSCLVDPFMVDSDGVKRPPILNDCVMNSRLVEGLDIIQMPYKMDVSYSDICSEDSVLVSNFAFMSNMSKHYICAPHNIEEARLWVEMCEIMAGSPLKKKKIVSAYVSPISPLTLDKGFLELVEYLAPQGVMLIILPCPCVVCCAWVKMDCFRPTYIEASLLLVHKTHLHSDLNNHHLLVQQQVYSETHTTRANLLMI